MVRCAKRPLAEARVVEAGAGQALDRRAGQRLVVGHRRQQRRQPLRQHRLAGARRADQQQAVAAGRGDLERALGLHLALDVAQVGGGRSRRSRRRLRARQRLCGIARLQRLHHLQQGVGGAHVDAGDARRGRGAGRRQHQHARFGRRTHAERQRERAAHRPKLAGQRQLAGEFVAGQPRRLDLAAGGQDAQRDRQVEAARFLRQVGRRQVDRDALVVRKGEAALRERGAHPLARFLHFGLGQPHQREAGQAVGQVHFDGDRLRLQRIERTAVDDGEGHGCASCQCPCRCCGAGASRRTHAGGARGAISGRRRLLRGRAARRLGESAPWHGFCI